MNGFINSSLFTYRQSKEKCTALSLLTFQPDTAAMMFDDFLADGKTQAGSLRFVRQCITAYLFKLFKYRFIILFGNSDTRVFNTDNNLISLMDNTAINLSFYVNFTAFEMRLTTTWIILSGSPEISGRPGSMNFRSTIFLL